MRTVEQRGGGVGSGFGLYQWNGFSTKMKRGKRKIKKEKRKREEGIALTLALDINFMPPGSQSSRPGYRLEGSQVASYVVRAVLEASCMRIVGHAVQWSVDG